MLSSLLRRPPLHREALYGASPATALFCRGVRMVRMRLCDTSMRMLLIWISIFVSGLSHFLFRGLVEVVIFGMLWRSARINMSVERLRSRKGKRHSFILVLLVFYTINTCYEYHTRTSLSKRDDACAGLCTKRVALTGTVTTPPEPQRHDAAAPGRVRGTLIAIAPEFWSSGRSLKRKNNFFFFFGKTTTSSHKRRKTVFV